MLRIDFLPNAQRLDRFHRLGDGADRVQQQQGSGVVSLLVTCSGTVTSADGRLLGPLQPIDMRVKRPPGG